MPYIPQSDRDEFAEIAPCYPVAENAGQLNYLITELVNGYMRSQKKSYKSINEVIGALECAKLELYRRIAAPYEDKKCKENGDVYFPELLK